MIKSFADRDTEALWLGDMPRRFSAIGKVALRKLDMLNSAVAVTDLLSPPGNRLEAMKGNRKGQYSSRINDQWRVCFTWTDGEACDVEIVDYH